MHTTLRCVSFNSQLISEAVLSAFKEVLESERKKLSEELQDLLDEDLTDAEKEYLLQQMLEQKLRVREFRRQYRKAKIHVKDTFYKKSWLDRIRFAERSDGSPDLTLKMIATPPTDNNVYDDCYRWGGAVDALSA